MKLKDYFRNVTLLNFQLFQKCNTTQFSFSCALFVFKNMNIDRYCALLQ